MNQEGFYESLSSSYYIRARKDTVFFSKGKSLSAIAAELGRFKATISREFKEEFF